MLHQIKTIVTRAPANLLLDATGAVVLVAIFAVALHVPGFA